MKLQIEKTKMLGALVASLFWLASACSHASTQNASSTTNATPVTSSRDLQKINITRSGSISSSQGPAEYFTGSARIETLINPNEPSRLSGASVTFEPGARTAWHTHPLGQTLIVTAGTGWVQQEGGEKQEIRPGDVVWTPPGVKHWHGATATDRMTHIAIQEALDGKVVEWMEKVRDEQYGGR
jgi:quercetin dioxygenase-like cupin family protein